MIVIDVPTPTAPPRCNDFDLRLGNTSSSFQGTNLVYYAGTVETCFNGSYFSICDIGWDDVEAQLICNALGLIEPYYRKLVLQKAYSSLCQYVQFTRKLVIIFIAEVLIHKACSSYESLTTPPVPP